MTNKMVQNCDDCEQRRPTSGAPARTDGQQTRKQDHSAL